MSNPKSPVVKYLDQSPPIDCPFGHVKRIITGGEGGVANVHVVSVTKGSPHSHAAYDEVYYVLKGRGQITMAGQSHALRPGAAVIIPAGVAHGLEADPGETLEFVIVGSPAMSIDDPRATPQKA